MRGRLALLLALPLCTGCNDGPATSATAPATTTAAAPRPEQPSPDAPPPAVRITQPQMTTRQGVLETTGKVAFNEERLVRVHAPVTGRVIDVLARPGDVVEPGFPLLVMDSPELSTAKADYAKATADVERADKALALVRELVDARALAQKELRDADSDYRKAMAERERAMARLRTLGVVAAERFHEISLRADTGTTVTVTAPRSGVVVERNVSPGQVVAYGQSDSPANLFLIADLGTMWVLADVYEPDVFRVHPGQVATVTLPCCPGVPYQGTVGYIADVVDPQTRTLKVRVVVPNRGRSLKAEMFVKVALATGSSTVMTVPQSAVHREDGKTFVLVTRGQDDYERRPVRLGADLNGTVEVIDGIGRDDRVVTEGSILLKRAAK